MCAFELDTGEIEGFEYISLTRITLAANNSVMTLYYGPGTITLNLRAIKDARDAKAQKPILDLYNAFLSHCVTWVRSPNDLITGTSLEISEDEEFASMKAPGDD